MIPIQYALLVLGPLNYAVGGFSFGAIVGIVLTIVFRPSYDRLAEYAETLTADKAQALADHFAAIAKELRTPGK